MFFGISSLFLFFCLNGNLILRSEDPKTVHSVGRRCFPTVRLYSDRKDPVKESADRQASLPGSVFLSRMFPALPPASVSASALHSGRNSAW